METTARHVDMQPNDTIQDGFLTKGKDIGNIVDK